MSALNYIQDSVCADYNILSLNHKVIPDYIISEDVNILFSQQPKSVKELEVCSNCYIPDSHTKKLLNSEFLKLYRQNPVNSLILATTSNQPITTAPGTILSISTPLPGFFDRDSPFFVFLSHLTFSLNLHNGVKRSLTDPAIFGIGPASKQIFLHLRIPPNHENIAKVHQAIFCILKNAVLSFDSNGLLDTIFHFTDDFNQKNFDKKTFSEVFKIRPDSLILFTEVVNSSLIFYKNPTHKSQSISLCLDSCTNITAEFQSIAEACTNNFSLFRFYSDDLPSFVVSLCNDSSFTFHGPYFVKIKNHVFFAILHTSKYYKDLFEDSVLPERLVQKIDSNSALSVRTFKDSADGITPLPWYSNPVSPSFARLGRSIEGSPVFYENEFPVEYLHDYDDIGLDNFSIGKTYRQSSNTHQILNGSTLNAKLDNDLKSLSNSLVQKIGSSCVLGCAALLNKENEKVPQTSLFLELMQASSIDYSKYFDTK